MNKAVLIVVLFAAALVTVDAVWEVTKLTRDATEVTKPVCYLKEAEALALGMPLSFTHCKDTSGNSISTRTPCCNDVNFVENGRDARDRFVGQLEADHWVYAEEEFDEYPFECAWGWDNNPRYNPDTQTFDNSIVDCSSKEQPVIATGSYDRGSVVTKVTAFGKKISGGTTTPDRGVLHIHDAIFRAPGYDYTNVNEGDGVARDLFGRYVQVIGENVIGISDVFMNFTNPIQGLGFYMRDISTSPNRDQDKIITIFCNSGEDGEVPVFPVDGIQLLNEEVDVSTDDGVADVTYFSARYLGPCDSSQGCKSLKFTNIFSEDNFGIDGMVFAHPGTSCDDSSISGYVYSDANSNGFRDAGETALEECSGTNSGSILVDVTLCKEYRNTQEITECVTTTTDSSGYYEFTGLRPSNNQSNLFAYRLREGAVRCYDDGSESVGTFQDSSTVAPGAPVGVTQSGTTASGAMEAGFGGPILNDEIGQIFIQFGGQTGTGFNFGEISQDPCVITPPVGCYTPATAGNPTRVCKQQDRLGVALKWTPEADCQ